METLSEVIAEIRELRTVVDGMKETLDKVTEKATVIRKDLNFLNKHCLAMNDDFLGAFSDIGPRIKMLEQTILPEFGKDMAAVEAIIKSKDFGEPKLPPPPKSE